MADDLKALARAARGGVARPWEPVEALIKAVEAHDCPDPERASLLESLDEARAENDRLRELVKMTTRERETERLATSTWRGRLEAAQAENKRVREALKSAAASLASLDGLARASMTEAERQLHTPDVDGNGNSQPGDWAHTALMYFRSERAL